MSCSDEFERQISSSSVMDSSSTYEDTNEEVEEVGTRISYDRIPEVQDPSRSTSLTSIDDSVQRESVDSTSHLVDSEDSRNIEHSQAEKRSPNNESRDRSTSTSPEKKADTPRTKEVESLEGWDRVIGGEMRNSKRILAKKPIIYPRDRSASHGRSTVRRAAKPDVPSPEVSARIHSEKGTNAIVNATTREIDSSSSKRSRRKNETALSPHRRTRKSSESSPSRDATSGIESPSNPTEMEKMNDRRSLKNHEGRTLTPKGRKSPRKSPTEILEDYAAKNDKRVEYKVLQSKANLSEIECYFAGYVAKRVGSSEIMVKNEVAAIILRMLAEKQMDEQDMKNLEDFTDDQMRDIIALGTDGKPENAMRKLYKCCLEKNAAKPVYTVKGSNEVEGFKHFAECRALGKVGQGSAIRDEIAKISAAEELYTKLRLENSSP